jgi:hypothetical protein
MRALFARDRQIDAADGLAGAAVNGRKCVEQDEACVV